MGEKELIKLLQDSPAEGIEKAIDLYGKTVKWIAAKVIGEGRRQDVEECVADTFVKLWKGIDHFQGGELSKYVNGIARHTAIDRRRKNERAEGAVSLESMSYEGEELGVEVDFAEDFAKKVNAAIVKDTVESLTPPDDAIFIGRYFLGQSVREIAEKLGLSPKAVENKLYRGKAALREALVERGIIL